MTRRISSMAFHLLLFVTPAIAAESTNTVMKEVIVLGEQKNQFLPDVKGAKIYSGKKTSLINPEDDPIVVNNNYRQVFEETPGLLLSEESTPLFSLGYRGLKPDRGQMMQVLKDGIPIHADMFGYPEAYYTPVIQSVDEIEFISGGGALLYGPQPGGALNFITKDPYLDAPFAGTFENSVGSHDFYSNYTALTGTQDNLGYYGWFHHRQSQGFRAHNSDFDVFSGATKLKWAKDDNASYELNIDGYDEEHGEPGGLTRSNFEADPSQSTRLNDRFELKRYAGSLTYEADVDADTAIELRSFGGYYERWSKRQRSNASAFGLPATGPNSNTNDIQQQKFYSGGTEARVRQGFDVNGVDNTLTVGGLYHHSTSPRIDKRGSTPDAVDGTVTRDTDRTMNYVSLFAEDRLDFGQLSLTPGVRLENIWQDVKENINASKTTVSLGSKSEHDFVPLFGLGAEYELTDTTELYSNISQAYRPKLFTEAVPTGSGQTITDDLEEGKSWQFDVGARGNLNDFISVDGSYFYMEFNDQIGSVGSTGQVIQNVGDARHQGVELAGKVDLIGGWDALRDTSAKSEIGSLSFFSNVTYLDAEFTKGPNKGLAPQYAPDLIFKTGLEYNYMERTKVKLAGTFVDDHFANDSNSTTFTVPSYKVWDLTSEFQLHENLSLFGGINNLFDEKYFARVTSAGIDPADGRNYYAGLKLDW